MCITDNQVDEAYVGAIRWIELRDQNGKRSKGGNQ